MDEAIPLGQERIIDGRLRVYCYGYWIKAYEVPPDTLFAKRRLIEALTRRLFNHVEHGMNVPGSFLEVARRAYESEQDPQRKRVKGAMLAGGLFNRATDIITKLVEVQALGGTMEHAGAVMRECGQHLAEALTLGRMVLHRSGEEGLDELWGEPFKAFSFPIEEFYRSRYIKIAQSMEAIEVLRDEMIAAVANLGAFEGVGPLITDFARAAQIKCETLRTDPEIFDVWTSFAVAAEKLVAFKPATIEAASMAGQQQASQGIELIARGKDLISYITRARVPMPKSTREFVERCERFRALYVTTSPRRVLRAGPEEEVAVAAVSGR
jgi:hypothetical protein